AVCAMHNTSSVPVLVRPTIKFTEARVFRKVLLRDILLKPGGVTALNLLDLQNSGIIPKSFNIGTLELFYDGPAGSLIAELTNFDVKGGYVLGSSFSGYPSKGVGGTYWRTDGDWQSLIAFTNAAQQEDSVEVELFYENGSYL